MVAVNDANGTSTTEATDPYYAMGKLEKEWKGRGGTLSEIYKSDLDECILCLDGSNSKIALFCYFEITEFESQKVFIRVWTRFSV